MGQTSEEAFVDDFLHNWTNHDDEVVLVEPVLKRHGEVYRIELANGNAFILTVEADSD